MATPYVEIYEFFLSKISDYSFLNLTDEELEDDLRIYLKTAIADFDICKSDLSDRDETIKQFQEDLTDKEKDILARLMVVSYLKPRVVTSENYRLSMSDSDYKTYSQANHIKEIMKIYNGMRSEVDKLIVKYSYRGADLDKLT
jgi:hypothetical protein